MSYTPPFTVSEHVVRRVADIAGAVERYSLRLEGAEGGRLRKINRLRSIQFSCAIEANSLSLNEVIALFDGKRVVASENEIIEIKNAHKAYAGIEKYCASDEKSLLRAHKLMTSGLWSDAGRCLPIGQSRSTYKCSRMTDT